MLFRKPVLAGPTRAGSKPIPSSETVTVTPPDWLRRAVSMAARTPAWAATLHSASPVAALSASTAASGTSRSTSRSHRTSKFGRGLDCATQRGPQVGQAVAFEGHLPG